MRDNICYLLEQGVATFLFGDHSEFNTLCYEVVSELREVYHKIRRIHYRTDYPCLLYTSKMCIRDRVNCLADECVCADEIRQAKERYRRERSFNGSKDQ